jgi:splicing factor 3A subunit 2
MDFQNRVGVKFGGGGVADASQLNAERRERLKRLALETIDLSKDPYFMKNHVGSFECKLCLTIHTNEGSYLAHTQGKKHSANLARRAAKEQKDQERSAGVQPAVPIQIQAYQQAQQHQMYSHMPIRKVVVKIGRPGYKVTKVYNFLM